ncbi:uncharacterized protein BHQ10_010278 [Talaromyces amestolkiae]|uniref:Uncharacterized protein n=1 Tax=Talaromyces amestolkiae TaxID=1196081 RepID=A0A364LEM1_TALAM|nr:uncharacterized protein BHQ10_010278 [Talaromyces amestolkiae]RAO74266.1 hypothetical protein BHQ10_010278 [Talaromyces amestolkiae]
MNQWGQESSHCYVAKVCLRLLIDTYTEEFYYAWKEKERNSIREYARDFWAKHVQTQEEQKVDSLLADLLKTFLGSPEESSTQYRVWTLEIEREYENRPSKRSPVSYFGLYALFPVKRSILAMCYFPFYMLLQDWWESAEIHFSEMTDNGQNVLCIAAREGNRKICEALIRRGMNVNQPDRLNGSALATAALAGHLDIVNFLIEKGSDVNQILRAGYQAGDYGSALAAAAYNGHPDIIKILIEKGSDVNQILEAGKFGSALAAAAVLSKNTEIVRYLIQQGANVNQFRQAGDFGSALIAAANNGHLDTVKCLIEQGANINFQDRRFGSALAAAAAGYESIEKVQYLVEQGANVNEILQAGHYGSALAAAANSGFLDTVKYLVEQGANVNQSLQAGDYGSALAAAAAGYGSIEKVQYLVEQGANVNQILQVGHYGSALAAAAHCNLAATNYELAVLEGYRKIEKVQYLVEQGANVNQSLQAGCYGSALAAAAAGYKNKNMVKYLIYLGAKED